MLAFEIDFRRLAVEAFSDRSRALRLEDVIRQYDQFADRVEQTIWWRLRRKIRRLQRRPVDIVRPSAHVSAPAIEQNRYDDWLRHNSPRASDLDRLRDVSVLLPRQPTFSILMPIYQTPERYLRAAVESVLAQAYQNWELCVVDDASPSSGPADVIREYAARDPRIGLSVRRENGHIARASNDALAMARGEFIALLDHDDVLTADALFENALALNREPDLDMLYSDEDKIDESGRRSGAYFKPDWSPDTFLTKMYTGHLAVMRRSLVEEIGGFRAEFTGSQDYDLVLRISERTQRIHHIPRVLYSWRLHSESTSQSASAKTYAYEAALGTLQQALDRRGEGGQVTPSHAGLGHYTVRYSIRSFDRVSIVVPTRNGAFDVRRCLDSLFARTDYPNYEVVLMDNGSDRTDALELFASYRRTEPLRFRYLRHDRPFNFSELNNVAVRTSTAPYLLFLNNDTEILHDDWLTAMVEYAQRPSIGAVGAKLIYGNDTIQHAGVVLGIGGIAGHSHRHLDRSAGGYANNVRLTTNYSAVTAACLMLRRDVFTAVGGFDETFPVAYNDVDLCLRIRERGLYNVYLPHVELMHYESQTRGYDVDAESIERDRNERARLQQRWQQAWSVDPFYSPHLTLGAENFGYAP